MYTISRLSVMKVYKPFTRVKLGVENYQPKIKSGSLCSELNSFLSKFLACLQTLSFLFTDRRARI